MKERDTNGSDRVENIGNFGYLNYASSKKCHLFGVSVVLTSRASYRLLLPF